MLTIAQALESAQTYYSSKGRRKTDHRIVTDTSDFFKIEAGDILYNDAGAYLITGHEHEGRFGLDEQPKPWVKKAVDLESEQRKVIKLEFHEKFTMQYGIHTYDCYRSPKKEARILGLVQGNPHFMQGFSTYDEHGSNIRIIDFVPGPALSQYVEDLNQSHEYFFEHTLPGLLELLRPCLENLAFLHRHHEKHGDVRRDHLILSPENRLVWIDFDYNYRHGEHIGGLDIAGLGNILAFVMGGGDQTISELRRNRPGVLDHLTPDDMSLVFPNRVMNLKKVFPYLPDPLNHILLHYSSGTPVFYDTVDELLQDFYRAEDELIKS